MPSQPQAILQAVASYKCSDEAVSTRKEYSSASLDNTQNVKKARLRICGGVACNRLGPLTSLGLISAHVCVSIVLQQGRRRFRRHQLGLHISAHSSLLAAAQPSLSTFFLLSMSLRSSPAHLVVWVHFT